MRPLTTTVAAAGAAAAVTGALVLSAGGAGAADAASSGPTTPPQRTVRGTLIRVQNGTLAVGSQVPNNHINARRTYFGNSWAVTLGHDRQGAVYPVQTGNGGRHWRTVGPALWVPAADAPNVVNTVTAASRTLQYAYGGGGQVVDVTRDGGPQWRRATFDGTVLAVSPGVRKNELVAFVNNGAGVTWQFVTRDGGATWTYFPRYSG
ncbi:MAG TPA: hypothetical protein VKV21_07195 [Solirubrobacteraceae bacterium]|nr:hypothetical protein [Solirubrobacteraceae bacterium]